MEKSIKYTFHPVDACNMCGADASQFKILGKRMNTSNGKNPKKKIGISTTICRCQKCDLVFSNPLPIPENINDHYDVNPENYWKEEYFEVEADYYKVELDNLERLSGKPLEGMTALDIGAGIGKCITALKLRNMNVFAIEPTSSFYNYIIKTHPDLDGQISNKAIEEAEFEKESFDFITFGAVLEHLYDPSSSIEKVMSWLKPGGYVHIEVPNSDWTMAKLFNRYYKLIGSDYTTHCSPMHNPFHLYEFTGKTFEKNAQKNNYSVADITYYVSDTYVKGIISKILKGHMKRNNSGMQISIWLQKK